MKRRSFLRDAGAAAAASCFAPRLLLAQAKAPSSAQSLQATLTVDESTTLATVPQDFIGLSYESAQLANPAFFAAENTALSRALPRVGQRRSAAARRRNERVHCIYNRNSLDRHRSTPWVPTPAKTSTPIRPITPKSLRNLRAFLDATGWRCLYGLNLGRGTIERAAEEASYVQRILGPRLIAFQLGNEPDAWRTRYRPSTWSYVDYWKEWSAARAAVVARVPAGKVRRA